MERQFIGTLARHESDWPTPLQLTEQHLADWLQLLDRLQDAHAPTDELLYCRSQVTKLQLDLYQLRDEFG